MDAEHKQMRIWHQMLFSHPAWATLQSHLASQGIVVAQGLPQPGQWEPKLLLMHAPIGVWGVAPDDPRAVTLCAYLVGPNGKKLSTTISLQTRECSVREPVFGEWPPFTS